MKWLCTSAAALAAAATMVLGGCATDQPQVAQAQQAEKNPCLGVAPPTGSLVRRKEDCGAARTQDDASKQIVIDEIRSKGGYNPTSVRP